MILIEPLISFSNFQTVVFVWIGFAIVLFPLLLKVTAPYGRHSKTNWGKMINNRAGWIIMESPSLIFMIIVIALTGTQSPVFFIASILWLIHYFNRTLVFPLRIKTRGHKMPLLIMFLALFFNLINGFLNSYALHFGYIGSVGSYIDTIRIIAGITIFFTGLIINHYHDHILIKLRKKNGEEYVVPHGGFFRFVSCPNFLGEVMEWAGFALFVWNLPSLSFLIWTMVNLVPRALDHHNWYRKKFDNYPENRKAIFPFLL